MMSGMAPDPEIDDDLPTWRQTLISDDGVHLEDESSDDLDEYWDPRD